MLEALEQCLRCNHCIFNNENYLQIDRTAQGPDMSCSYVDIAMADFDKGVLEYHLSCTMGKRFMDDIFVLWPHDRESLVLFLDYINTLHPTQKPINSFTYVLPTTCYPRKSINNIVHSIALRLRRICNLDEKFKHRSEEYKNYLIARDYHLGLVDKKFQKVEMTSRHISRKKNTKRKDVSRVKSITTSKPPLPSIENLTRKHIHYLHKDEVLKKSFPNNKFFVIYKRIKNLKEIVAPSFYLKPSIKSNHTIASFNKCNTC